MSVDPFSSHNTKKQTQAVEHGAELEAQSAQKAIDLQKEIYDQSRQDQAPWRDTGKQALNQLSHGIGLPGSSGSGESGALSREFSMADFEADPGYEFRLKEGIKALDRSASAKGNLLSGSTMKGLQRYGQGLASQEYQNAYNRYVSNQSTKYNQLAATAGVGQVANNASGAFGANYANNAGNVLTAAGANQANAGMAIANINNSMYQGMANSGGQALNALGQWASNRKSGGSGGYSGNTYGGSNYQAGGTTFNSPESANYGYYGPEK